VTKQRSAATVDASEILRSPVDTVRSYDNLSHYLPRALAPSKLGGPRISEPSTTVFCPFALLFSPSNPEDLKISGPLIDSRVSAGKPLVSGDLFCCSPVEMSVFFVVWCLFGDVRHQVPAMN